MATKYHEDKFPPVFELDKEIQKLVNQARTELGRYDGFLSSMINSETLLSPLFVQEAVLSSKIEGTQSTLTEVLEFEGGGNQQNISKEKKEDMKEVLKYRYALQKATELLKGVPLSQRLFKASHKELMRGVRGENKTPGEYRKIPVWIGADKSNIETARFIPIEANKIIDAMGAFEKFLHNNEHFDDLIKIAILHAEFEAIHPFLDGNGRLGRMIIPLYLSEKNLLNSPSFYISSYFEKNKESYYNLLLNVSKNNEWLQWCKFFVKGIIEQSIENLDKAKKINEYYNELKNKIPSITKSQHGITALDFIFKKNYFNSTNFYKNANIPKPTAIRILSVFENEEILECIHGAGRKPNFYFFIKLIDIANGK